MGFYYCGNLPSFNKLKSVIHKRCSEIQTMEIDTFDHFSKQYIIHARNPSCYGIAFDKQKTQNWKNQN